mgnify:FL=1
MKITQKDYQNNWIAFQNGSITEKEWRAFCNSLLDQTLEENKDVMIRLKYR